jgi:hypothetical protein
MRALSQRGGIERRKLRKGNLSGRYRKNIDALLSFLFELASDPPSSLPDPNEDSFKRKIQRKNRKRKDDAA